MIHVSIIVPTKNRPQFLSNILRNFFRQDYPLQNMELIIGDDGNCEMEKLIPNKNNIKYYKFQNITLGQKRNELCELASGKYIIFMDDDDFYPADKVSHYVNLLQNSNKLLAGSSIMYVYFTKLNEILKFGSFGVNHCTCGTLAFKKEYFKNNKFPDVNKSEEKIFLNNFSIDMIQTDPLKSILVIAHSNNTVDKYKYYNKGIKTNLTLNDFKISDIDKKFYINLS